MALVGKQKKLDKNNNGRLDKEDFKMLGDSPAAYGTGSPFQLRKSKTFSPVDGNVVDKNKYTERRKDSIQKQKKARQATMDSSGSTYTMHTTGKRHRVGEGPRPNLK